MWWVLLTAGTVLLIKKIVDEWGWERNWKFNDIDELPSKPGIYIMYRRNKIIHVGSTKNLHQRFTTHSKRYKMTSFDWYRTSSTREAKRLEKKLQKKVGYQGR
ncbi:MAG: GIY-YIG nuclease family protein [bacterium]